MKPISILVLTEDYPNNEGGISLNYVHTRNLRYVNEGIEVDNLNFSATETYIMDGIRVLSFDDYEKEEKKYDILLLHAANIRHHYKFLKKYGEQFKHFIFFFHGHEVMRINKDYCKPYSFVKRNIALECLQNMYDSYKLALWKRYFTQNFQKCSFVFVSEWMRNIFIKNTKINYEMIKDKCYITYNSVGKKFEECQYNSAEEKRYDFVTIRSNIDGSKYAVDIVNEIAKNTPKGKFAVVGKGTLFDHIRKSTNIDWFNQTMNHDEIIEILNQSRFALMPTRTDAQGLMMCEMAAFGIPVITSDIDVCHEVFDGFENAYFISNDNPGSIDEFIERESVCIKDKRYSCENTTKREIDMINRIFKSID